MRHVSTLAVLALLLAACAKAPSDDKRPTEQSEGLIGYLTACAWNSAPAAGTVGIDCEVLPPEGGSLEGIVVSDWRVVDKGGNPVQVKQTPKGVRMLFDIAAQLVAGYKVTVLLTRGDQTLRLETGFAELLKGLLTDGTLQKCFDSEISVGNCFKLIGINLPVSDAFATTEVKPEDAACSKLDTLPPGTPCALDSDAIAGDYEAARRLYQEGNELVRADGTLRADEFCDANGVKAEQAGQALDRTIRRYPYWTTSTHEDRRSACFPGFFPVGTEANAAVYKKKVLFDPAVGRDGEPWCYFVLISEPNAFGGHFLRMHVLKNPKLFPDAANKVLTPEKLEAATSHFACP